MSLVSSHAAGTSARGRRIGRSHVITRLVASLLMAPNRWVMLALLLIACCILGLELWIGLQMAKISQALIDSLAQRDAAEFGRTLMGLGGLVGVMLPMTGLAMYVNLRLRMQARTALTHRWLRGWLDEKALYMVEREKRIDNPDQRIAEDLNLFLDKSLSLGLGALGAVGGVWAFSSQLWAQGGSLDVSLGGQNWSIPGYLFWVALAYSAFDLGLIRWIAKPQIGLNMQQQHFEADFRFALVQVRENAEQVAFHRGESAEFRRLAGCFELVRRNWMRLIAYQAGLQVYNSATGHFSSYLMYVLVAPRVLAGAVTIGTVGALQTLYGLTLSKLNWLAYAWSSIVEWMAVVRRLQEMDTAISQPSTTGVERCAPSSEALRTHDLVLSLPDGRTLATPGDLCILPGQRWLVRGSSGAGKSTLVRAIAGLWPHGSGRVEPPSGLVMFLPQKSYLPWDTLKVALAYPGSADRFSDEECRQALADCLLPKLVSRLHEQARWSMQLSLGEQQRLAFARVLLAKPDFLFLDESTSALDVETERHLYQGLLDKLPRAALVSVAHRPTLEAFHTHGIELHAEQPPKVAESLVPA